MDQNIDIKRYGCHKNCFISPGRSNITFYIIPTGYFKIHKKALIMGLG